MQTLNSRQNSAVELLQPGDCEALEEWDRFNEDSIRGHYCADSAWLASFGAYGLSYGVLVCRDESRRIAGGLPIVVAQVPLLGRHVEVPFGPIVSPGKEAVAEFLLDSLLSYARRNDVFLLQIQLAVSDEENPFVLPTTTPKPIGASETRNALSASLAPDRFQLVDLSSEALSGDWEGVLLRRFDSMTRRNIRVSERCGLELRHLRDRSELETGYRLIEAAGRTLGYGTRTWSSLASCILKQVSQGRALMLGALHSGQLVGSLYAVIAGRRLNYLMGASSRHDPKIKVGHFLHWHAIRLAKEKGLLGYDLTSGGPPGVRRFKSGFAPTVLRLVPRTQYVLGPTRQKIFALAAPALRKHKRRVAWLLHKIAAHRQSPS